MRKILALLTVFGLSMVALTSAAQNTSAKVIGQVTNGQKSIEAATILLLRFSDSLLIKSTITDNTGNFIFEKDVKGKFFVSVQAIGFEKYFSEPFNIDNINNSYIMKEIVLLSNTNQLSGVTVTAKKPFIEQKLDKMVVNVDASPTNIGLTALDILEKSPGVTVDKDGNISLKGKAGVLILMDGKQTYLSGADLANLLKNTASSNLDQIEIMTNPSAKYDAAGNSGIINIKTKKSKVKGFNGSVTLGGGLGFYPKANESINLNYRSGKVNIFGNYSYNYNKGFQNLDLNRNFRDSLGALASVYKQHTDMVRNYQTHNYKAGIDYFASKKTTIGFVVNGYVNPGNFNSSNKTDILNKLGGMETQTLSNSSSKEKWVNFGTNLNFRHTFDSTGRELTADIDYLKYTSNLDQLFNNSFYNSAGVKTYPDEILRGDLPGTITIYSGKIDYTHPLKSNAKLEAGIKSSYVETDNNAAYDNYINGNWQMDSGRSNHFIYKENINAAYINLSKQFSKKWSVQAGLRLENTNADGDQLTTNTSFAKNYTQLFPTAYIGYTLNDKNQFSINYGRRVERPDYEDLNPFYFFLDKYTYQVGNPYLQPQFGHNIELTHTFNGILTSTLSYNNTNDVIQDVIEQVDSIHTSYVHKSNVARFNSIGLSMNAGFPVTKWWTTNIYAQVIKNHYEGFINDGFISVGNTGFMTNISNQFKLPNGWSMELSGFYRGKMIEGTLVANPMGVINLGVAKTMLKNKATLKLNFRDPFSLQEFNGYTKFQNIDVTIRNQWDNRVLNLSFTYRFAKGQTSKRQDRGGADDEQNRVKGSKGQ